MQEFKSLAHSWDIGILGVKCMKPWDTLDGAGVAWLDGKSIFVVWFLCSICKIASFDSLSVCPIKIAGLFSVASMLQTTSQFIELPIGEKGKNDLTSAAS